ncbi:MAG TPA: hypothetical protein PLS77_00325 [Anaerolineaceae bacterium]|jgi:hypothetical protein|nr:hypothetical protein [Longilinea sp.]NMD32092.1 hypothetical protein [Chloroflexota bacterium]HNS63634.1 hypothetical protein [Anaerolineaceae bacterium]HNZ00276.1 hypothetical protein [Anaerolineaceae bacterium]HOD44856.1 hypothetical protein [Anaerolineaceae bacterium]
MLNSQTTLMDRIQIHLLEWATELLTTIRRWNQKIGLLKQQQPDMDQKIITFFRWVNRPTIKEMIAAISAGGFVGLVLGIFIYIITA